jgi:hypothetical protein
MIEPDLAVVFHTLQCTTILFNMHYYKKTPVDGTLIRQCLGFIHSTLIELEGRLPKTISECARLGMMAFLATTFRLPDLDEQHYSKSLANDLQLSYATAKALSPDLPSAIDVWLTVVLLISTDDIDGLYMCISWAATPTCELPWSETRKYLKQVMWIDSFHDDLGRRATRRMLNGVDPVDM